MMAATHDDVVAAVRLRFPQGDRDAVLRALDVYGALPHERERERVQLAIVELSGGDADRLRYFVQAAKRDYRDILSWQASGPLSPAEGEALQAKAEDLLRRWGKPGDGEPG
jgi:hypothetical protein